MHTGFDIVFFYCLKMYSCYDIYLVIYLFMFLCIYDLSYTLNDVVLNLLSVLAHSRPFVLKTFLTSPRLHWSLSQWSNPPVPSYCSVNPIILIGASLLLPFSCWSWSSRISESAEWTGKPSSSFSQREPCHPVPSCHQILFFWCCVHQTVGYFCLFLVCFFSPCAFFLLHSAPFCLFPPAVVLTFGLSSVNA